MPLFQYSAHGITCSSSNERDFHKKEPLHETAVHSSWSRRIRRFFAGWGLGMGLLTSSVITAACSSDSQQEQRLDQTEKFAGTTNVQGEVSFHTSHRTFMLRIRDFDTGEAVSGLTVLFVARANEGVFAILDPANRYFARVLATETEGSTLLNRPRFSADFSSASTTTTVVQNANSLCDAALQYSLQSRTVEEWSRMEDRHSENSLMNQLFRYTGRTVSLRDLNNALVALIQIAAGESLQQGIEEAIRNSVKLGVRAGQALSLVGLVLTELDACTAKETLNWGVYYRNLCYQEDDQFEIWKLRNTIPEIGADITGFDLTLVSNPMFIVIPVQNRQNWQAPTARIDGRVVITDVAKRFLRPPIQVGG